MQQKITLTFRGLTFTEACGLNYVAAKQRCVLHNGVMVNTRSGSSGTHNWPFTSLML